MGDKYCYPDSTVLINKKNIPRKNLQKQRFITPHIGCMLYKIQR